MNKYEEYLEMREFFNAVLCGSTDKYYEKKNMRDKRYLYTKLRDLLLKEVNNKLLNEDKEKARLMVILKNQLNLIKDIKDHSQNKKYSDSDIEFLKQFSGFDLTLEEACLVGKRDEYYTYLRSVSYEMGNISRKLYNEIQTEIKSINGDSTPRLIWNFYNKHKKSNKC